MSSRVKKERNEIELLFSSFSFIADNQKLQESGTDEDARSGNSHLEMAAPVRLVIKWGSVSLGHGIACPDVVCGSTLNYCGQVVNLFITEF